MMAAVEINFWTREVTVGGPNGMMWVQLSTAIVFGLAFSKMITLGLVPAMLALPYRWRERRARKRGETYNHAHGIPDNVVADMNRRRAEREAAE
jgi:multidrug efflux pump